jgi:hypothetical protein
VTVGQDSGASRQGEYWAFYWPLAVTGAVGVVAVQLQNGVLARYPEAALELAVFALALGIYGLFNAALNFVPQLVTKFARTREARRVTLRFVIVLAAGFAVAVEAIGQTAAGAALLRAAFGIDGALLARVLAYLCLLAPILVLGGLRLAFVGLLVQLRLTGRVTLLNAVYLGTVAAILVTGFALAVEPTATLVLGQAGGALVHALLGGWLALSAHSPPETDDDVPDFPRLARFFFPVATTGVMFAVSRPVLYAFVARAPDGVVAIAAMRVAFDFTFFFQQASNQFRHFFVTFGLDDLPGKRRFMARVTVGITGLMLAVALTPLGDLFLRLGLGVSGEVHRRAVDVILVMTLLPTIIIVRNYFHGILMVTERTGGMALGGILRVALIAALAALLATFGLLDHTLAAWVLLAGFAIETAVVWWQARRAPVAGTPAS